LAAFTNLVCYIIGICTYPKMGWVYASWVVTCVTYTESLWDRSFEVAVGHAVGCSKPPMPEPSVTVWLSVGLPLPAAVANEDLFEGIV